jgi:hypothetical protein
MEPIHSRGLPTNLTPSFVLRSRRETNAEEVINSRLVNYWENDSEAIQRTNVAYQANDMNPTSSRLYREDLNRSQPFVTPAESVAQVKAATQLGYDTRQTLKKIQSLKTQEQTPDVVTQLKEQSILYNALAIRAKALGTDALAANPYFDKYDIATDSRNVIRELRGAVSEGVEDRGVVESQKLLSREMESRWVAPETAFELLRPKFNDMGTRYNK